MRILDVGMGAGSRDDAGRPNVLRAIVGEAAQAQTSEVIDCLQCNIDDMTGEELGALVEQLLAAGALDVYLAPVQMKKSRPAQVLTVLCRPEDREPLEERILRESTTLGVRRQSMLRRALPRRIVTVDTPHGAVRVKVATLPDGSEKVSAEFEDCNRIAREKGLALRDVMQAALDAFRRGA